LRLSKTGKIESDSKYRVTLLTNFEPCETPMEWDLGKHGIRISFTHHLRRYGATYLPDVAVEQGWTKEETIVSLMRKAGWSGRKSEWQKVPDLKTIRYQGSKSAVEYDEWISWRNWAEEQGEL
jgi:AMMECR1 domain-containing protein